MEAAFGRLHKGGRVALGRPPTFVETILGDGEAVEIAKPCANLYQICACVHTWPMLLLFSIVSLSLDKNTCFMLLLVGQRRRFKFGETSCPCCY